MRFAFPSYWILKAEKVKFIGIKEKRDSTLWRYLLYVGRKKQEVKWKSMQQLSVFPDFRP
jgi:hypothetical protein